MSHISKLDIKVKDLDVFKKTCQKLDFPYFTIGKHTVKMFGNQSAEVDASVQLPGWRYRVGIKDNEVLYDHWGSNSDTMHHLVDFTREYVLSAAEKLAQKKRRYCSRKQNLATGVHQLVVYV